MRLHEFAAACAGMIHLLGCADPPVMPQPGEPAPSQAQTEFQRVDATLLASDAAVENSKYSDQADRRSAVLSEAIKREIESLGKHAWAGEYYHGDGLGVNVSLAVAPQAGFLFEWHGCMGLYDRNYGTVTADQDRLRLSLTFPNKREGFQGIAEEFVRVPWGDRTYLVPTDDIVGFCNEVNGGGDPDGYLLRRGDEEKTVTGRPNVPAKFRPYLLAEPIEAEITEVGKVTLRQSVADWNFVDTVVTVDKGRAHGLLPGMQLFVTDPDGLIESVKIQEVEDDSSEGVMIQIGEDDEGPKPGSKLSTRAPWTYELPHSIFSGRAGRH